MNTDINFIEHKGICNAITYDESANKMKKKIFIDFFFKEYSFSCSFPFHCRNKNISAPLTNLEENLLCVVHSSLQLALQLIIKSMLVIQPNRLRKQKGK